MKKIIPFARPFVGKEEANAAKEVILSGWLSQGPKVKQFEDAFASYVGTRYACAVSSCTTALHLALIACGVKPGDVVITVSHSFIATANSIRHCGAEPVFIDIDLDTFNMSTRCLEAFLNEECEELDGQLYYKRVTELIPQESPLRYFGDIKGLGHKNKVGRIAAIMPVHQIGLPCDLNAILPLAYQFNLSVVEDAACAVGSEILMIGKKNWDKIGKPHADIACFSFHPRKLITTGEGGMLTTNDTKLDRKFRLLRQHGMNISDVVRHKAKKVIFEEYVETGHNYRMSDIHAAVGIEQIEKLPQILKRRREITSLYKEKLKNISWLKLPFEPDYCKTNWQSYPVRLLEDAPLTRDEFMQRLLDYGVSTRRGIMNAHQEKPYRSKISLKNSELARDTVVLLPIFNGMKEGQIEKVVKPIKNA